MARVRSPNYPQIPVDDAIGLVRKIHQEEATNFAPREVVAKLLGYSSVNGASEKKTSALSAYGLLDRNDERELCVSELAMRILFPHNEEEKVGAIAEAAMSPNLFKEIAEKWPDAPPSDESLKSYLVRRGFNQNSVEQVILVYRVAEELAHVESIGLESEEEIISDEEEKPVEAQAQKQQDATSSTIHGKPIIFDTETISGNYSFDNSDDLDEFIKKLEQIKPLLPSKN